MCPPKTLSFNEGVLLMEDVEAPKTDGSMEERLRKLEEDTHRYRIIVKRILVSHFLMSHDLEKKVEAYEERIKELEEKYLHTFGQLDRFQALRWDVENQNCEYEDH
jgi:chaperonin cofactor prefoldin